MFNNLQDRGPADRIRVNVHEAHELRYWTWSGSRVRVRGSRNGQPSFWRRTRLSSRLSFG